MFTFNDADVAVSTARAVFASNGERSAAEELRGLEVYSRGDAVLALSILRGLTLVDEDSRVACAAAQDVLRSTLAPHPVPSAAA